MSSISIAGIVLGCVFGSAVAGMALRRALPVHHFGEDSRDTVKLAIGIVATLSALVLGFLVASAKGSFDAKRGEVEGLAADVIAFDHILARYGPETRASRDLFRQTVAVRIAEIWPAQGSSALDVEATWGVGTVEVIERQISELVPRTPEQAWLRGRALEKSADLTQSRWRLIVQRSSAIPGPFLAVLVFWLCFIFACMGLIGPRNATVVAVVFVAAVSVSATLFLIMEMDRPYGGLITISVEPMRVALAQIGH